MRQILTVTVAAFALALSQARAADLSLSEAKEAKRIYIAKCAKCHKFYDPAGYSQTEWNVWMQKMGKKSKLKPAQFELLSKYLETFRSSAATGAK